ncbi:amidase [Pikeienuella piscinae]|uniref:Amidase n=2 Tax=Pikeienuella piscinae TaxID=2748098 RepID=A0A7M3T798_9RHOB|nr:amidase [Pikeienuella piscinae]
MIDAALARIEAVEPAINAMPTICAERAREKAKALKRGDEAVWLAGLPVAIKDLTPVEGVRTTWGTKALADFVPEESDPMVETLEARGAVVLGKSNTPEMGAGANTFNEVFGRTRNPWNTRLNPAGSSGGAAAALATGEVWLANGSDVGGSLRTPAAYCGVVGMRPTPGRASGGGRDYAFSGMGVQGPMARTVEDCALFLDAMAGTNPFQPLTFDAPAVSFRETFRRAGPPKRVAFSADWGGFAPVTREVRDLMAAAMRRLEGLGTVVEERDPPTEDLVETNLTLRGLMMAAGPANLPEEVRKHFKRTLSENIEHGLSLTAADIVKAERRRSAMFLEMEVLTRGFDALACPVVGLAPLDSEVEYPLEVDGVPTPHYMDWLKFAFLATTLGLPAISVPIGFTSTGAPMGIQLIGRNRDEAGILAVAKAIESVTEGFGRPIDPRG